MIINKWGDKIMNTETATLPVTRIENGTAIGWTHARDEEAIDRLVNHHKTLADRHLADSLFYQAQLFHARESLAQQQKGLRRQAKKIKRLQRKLGVV